MSTVAEAVVKRSIGILREVLKNTTLNSLDNSCQEEVHSQCYENPKLAK